MLICSEAAEALEEVRAGRKLTETYYKHSNGEPCSIPCGCPAASDKPEGVPSELADILIRTLELCAAYGIDADAILAQKQAYNESRPYKHGNKRF